MPPSGLSEPGLVTDLYELTMAQTYFQHGMSSRATFSLSIRNYPPNRGYFVAAGWKTCCDTWRSGASLGSPSTTWSRPGCSMGTS